MKKVLKNGLKTPNIGGQVGVCGQGGAEYAAGGDPAGFKALERLRVHEGRTIEEDGYNSPND